MGRNNTLRKIQPVLPVILRCNNGELQNMDGNIRKSKINDDCKRRKSSLLLDSKRKTFPRRLDILTQGHEAIIIDEFTHPIFDELDALRTRRR